MGRKLIQAAAAVLLLPGVLHARGTPGKTSVMIIPPILPNPNEQIAKDAYREVSRAQSAVSKAYAECQRDYEASADFREALEAARQARAELERVRASTLLQVRESDQYKSALLDVWKAQQSLEELRIGHMTGPAMALAAADVLRRREAITRMEAEATEDSDQLRRARYAAIDAEAKVAAMRESFSDSVRYNDRYRNAKSQLDAARARMDAIGR